MSDDLLTQPQDQPAPVGPDAAAPAPPETLPDPEPVLLDPRERRRNNVLTINIGGGRCVKARRLDMTTLVFEGLVPMPLLSAVQRMISMPGASPVEQLASMEESDKNDLLLMLRKHAIRAVIAPPLSLEDTGDENVLPVAELTLDELLTIYTGSALEAPMGAADATRFRQRAIVHDAAPISPRKNVQPAAKPVGPRPVAVDIKHA